MNCESSGTCYIHNIQLYTYKYLVKSNSVMIGDVAKRSHTGKGTPPINLS